MYTVKLKRKEKEDVVNKIHENTNGILHIFEILFCLFFDSYLQGKYLKNSFGSLHVSTGLESQTVSWFGFSFA